jgi:lysophospholipase
MLRELVALAKNPVPSGATVGVLTGAGGLPLRFARWEASQGPRRGTICLFGGRTEFIEKYFEVVADLRRRGFAVATMDWRGQGGSARELSNPRKGYVKDFALYDEDLRLFMREIVMPDCPPPYIALGHSMGGNIVLRSTAIPGVWWDKVVLSAPMVRLHRSATSFSFSTVKVFGELLCSLGGGALYVPGGSDNYGETAPFEGNKVTSDRERFLRNNAVVAAHPELGLGSPTWGWLRAAFRSMDRVNHKDFAPRVHVPVLVAIAGEDRIADSAALEDFSERLKLSKHIVIPHAEHEILQERDELRQQFWAAFDGFVGIGALA